MKKKLLLISLLTISLFIFSGCNKTGKKESSKENITINDSTLGYKTSFFYDKNDGFKFVRKETGGKYSEIIFNNQKKNLAFDMYYSQTKVPVSESLKESRSEKKYYKEYKFDKYDAYVYNDYDDELYLVINLNKDTKTNYITELFVSIEKIDYNTKEIVFDIFNDDVIQKFFNSIKITVD